MKKKFYLGSNSPRRKEILSYFSIPFTQISSHFDESSVEYSGDPIGYASLLSRKKAEALQDLEGYLLTADTVVEKGGKVFEKPKDLNNAIAYLQELQGSSHRVITALTLFDGKQFWTTHQETFVHFHTLSQDEINAYLSAISWQDKAGGYAIQGAGGVIIKKIEGCFYNVMGLPVNALAELLKKIGIDLIQCIK